MRANLDFEEITKIMVYYHLQTHSGLEVIGHYQAQGSMDNDGPQCKQSPKAFSNTVQTQRTYVHSLL